LLLIIAVVRYLGQKGHGSNGLRNFVYRRLEDLGVLFEATHWVRLNHCMHADEEMRLAFPVSLIESDIRMASFCHFPQYTYDDKTVEDARGLASICVTA